MLFKNFEIKQCMDGESSIINKYEIVKWREGHSSCFTIGYITYDFKKNWWEFKGCGLRYQEYYEEGLNEFILKYIELLDLRKKYYDKEVEEFYGHY